MFNHRRVKRLLPRLLHGLVVVVATAGYLVAVLGVPVRQPVRKDGGPAFPCQDHPCGCATAEQCWSNCCCFTPEERLAWAKRHQVEVPAALAWNSPRQRDLHAEEPKQCCSAGGSCGHACHDAAPECCAKQERKTQWVLGTLASKCRGVCTLWLTLGIAVPPPPITQWEWDGLAVDWLRPEAETAASPLDSPTTPPPRA
jgi:hypothetical protein